MSRLLRSTLSLVLALALLAVGAAQGTPAAQLVVERFAAALSDGETLAARELLSPATTWVEYDAYPRVAATRLEVAQRVAELIRSSVRLETEVVAIVGDGSIVIAHERMWGDFLPENLAPLRSTTVYVVEAGWLLSITRTLVPEHREALLAGLTVGAWSRGGDVFRHDLDGTYSVFTTAYDRVAKSIDPLAEADTGTFSVERGATTYVSGEASRVCAAGERLVLRMQFMDADTVFFDAVLDQTDCAYYRRNLAQLVGTYVRLPEE